MLPFFVVAYRLLQPRFPFCYPGRHPFYAQLPPLEPSFSFFPSRTTPAAQERRPDLRPQGTETSEGPNSKRFLKHHSASLFPVTCLLPRCGGLSGWQRQGRNPPHHGSEELPRQIAFGQQQPVIASVFQQPSTRLRQPLRRPSSSSPIRFLARTAPAGTGSLSES